MVGTTISHYKVIEKIGEGGMGEVYRAEDTNLSREVVIKVLPEQFTQDPQRLARFEREAKLLASLDHPNIAAMYEFEETEGLGILSLEFVEGETLAERLTKGLLPIKETLEIADQIAQALEFVHEKGFIHNDLKPSNVMVTPEGKVKILDFGLADFGLAKVFEWETSTLRELGGTPAYASPEQLLGKLRDTRTDLFSLGVMLYEMATGSRPFTGKTLSALAAEIINNTPTSPARLNPDVPPELVSIINKALEKDPEIRYQRIGELLEDLNRLRLGVTTIDSKALQYTEFFLVL